MEFLSLSLRLSICHGVVSKRIHTASTFYQGHCIFEVEYLKRCVLVTKLLKNTNRKSCAIYRIVTLSMTLSDLWPRFQGHDIFRHWISQKRHEIEPYYRTSIGSRMRSIAQWHLQWLDGPLTRFSRSRQFWSRLSQKRCVLGTMLLKNTNRKPYTIFRMVPLSIPLNDLWPRFQGHDVFEVEYRKNHWTFSELEDKVTIAQ